MHVANNAGKIMYSSNIRNVTHHCMSGHWSVLVCQVSELYHFFKKTEI